MDRSINFLFVLWPACNGDDDDSSLHVAYDNGDNDNDRRQLFVVFLCALHSLLSAPIGLDPIIMQTITVNAVRSSFRFAVL